MRDVTAPAPSLSFHGGIAGALLPFGLFLFGVGWLGISGAPDERGFWPVLVAALFLAMLLAKDRRAWADAVVAGMSRPLVTIMILAWLLAGVLGALLGAGGLVESLVWLARSAGVSGGGYTVAAFLICCVVSTSIGTSLGTVILCAPLLYPAGGALAAEPAILMGAILGGATFGDNISPVSDTTIASALTQGADMGGVVRSRLRYALPAAAAALVVYAVLGGGATTGAAIGNLAGEASPRGLPMVIAPLVALGLLFAGRHLIEGLLAGIATAVAVGLALGLVAPAELMRIDAEAYAAGGLIVDGLGKGIGVSIFTFLLMGLVAGIEAAGVIDRVVALAHRRTRSAASAEWWTFATVSAATLLTTHSTVAILTVGDFTRRMGERFGIDAYRRANLLDVTVCGWPMTVPFFIPAIVTASTTAAGAGFGMPRLSPATVGLANAHAFALFAVMLLSLATGWGRRSAPA